MQSLVPPSDPRLCPDLEVAMPADSVVTTDYRKSGEPWVAMFGDCQWQAVEVRSWWRDRKGRWVVQAAWSALGERWTGAYLYDPEKMRPAVDGVWVPPRPRDGGVTGTNLRRRRLSLRRDPRRAFSGHSDVRERQYQAVPNP